MAGTESRVEHKAAAAETPRLERPGEFRWRIQRFPSEDENVHCLHVFDLQCWRERHVCPTSSCSPSPGFEIRDHPAETRRDPGAVGTGTFTLNESDPSLMWFIWSFISLLMMVRSCFQVYSISLYSLISLDNEFINPHWAVFSTASCLIPNMFAHFMDYVFLLLKQIYFCDLWIRPVFVFCHNH